MIFARFITAIVPTPALEEIVERFQINGEQLRELCIAVASATRNSSPRQQEPIEHLRERLAIFRNALTQFQTMTETTFFPHRDGSMFYSTHPPDPSGEAHKSSPGEIPAIVFEQMLQAVISYVDHSVRLYDAESADKKALRTRTDLVRHRFWFALLVFWYHDLGRKLAVTKDPNNYEVRGPLVEFIEAMSANFVSEGRRTRAAIAGFVARNRTRVMRDLNFGNRRRG